VRCHTTRTGECCDDGSQNPRTERACRSQGRTAGRTDRQDPPESPRRPRRAIELLATGKCKTQTEAAEQVGTTRETLCRNLAKPHILEFMRQRAMRTIAMAAGRAAEVKAELLDCADNMVRDRSSTFVLGVAGIAPATAPGLAVNIKAGYVIDLTDGPRPGADGGMRIISPTVYSPPIDADVDRDSAK
jgi:hypothetical protein